MDFASRLGSWVLATPRWKFLTVLFTLMFFRTGVTFVAPTLVPIAEHPYRNPFTDPYEHYLYWSRLGPYLAHQVGATDAATLTMFYFVFAILFSILMVRWIFAVLDDRLARVAMLVFALLPVSAVPYYWIFNDSLTLFLLACALDVRVIRQTDRISGCVRSIRGASSPSRFLQRTPGSAIPVVSAGGLAGDEQQAASAKTHRGALYAVGRLRIKALRRQRTTSSPRWLWPRCSKVTMPASGREPDSRRATTSVSA